MALVVETAITFNREDHPDCVHHSGRYPLMVCPIVGTSTCQGAHGRGSGLNILYASTLDRMKIPRSTLRPSKAPFYEIIPGKEAVSGTSDCTSCLGSQTTFARS